MIPGRAKRYKAKHFRAGLTCSVVGCTRRARHQWSYPCAVNTLAAMPETTWAAVCDLCDIELNRRMLEVLGVPDHVLEDLLATYALIQGDVAYT